MRITKNKKYRLLIAAAIVIIVGVAIAFLGRDVFNPLPETTQFRSRFFTFIYPRVDAAKEYSSGVVSVGSRDKDSFTPRVEVIRYQSDPDVAAPTSYAAFVARQAVALCGTDSGNESVSCSDVKASPYTNTNGSRGQLIAMTLTRKNLTSGTTTTSTYQPIYVFNTSQAATEDRPLRYSAIFIYPSFSGFLANATSSPIAQIADTIIVPDGLSTIE